MVAAINHDLVGDFTGFDLRRAFGQQVPTVGEGILRIWAASQRCQVHPSA
jgi:hypothetical protein